MGFLIYKCFQWSWMLWFSWMCQGNFIRMPVFLIFRGWAGSLLLRGFLAVRAGPALAAAQASRRGGFSCCRAGSRACGLQLWCEDSVAAALRSRAQAQQLWCFGLSYSVAWGPSWIGRWACVSCNGRLYQGSCRMPVLPAAKNRTWGGENNIGRAFMFICL